MRIPLFGTWKPADWLFKAIGMIFGALAFYGIAEFPVFNLALFSFAIAYLILLVVCPLSWLVIIPLMAVGVDLTQSSGRIVVNEWDFALWLTISASYLSGKVALPQVRFQRLGLGLILLLVLLLMWSAKIWLLFEYIAMPLWHNPYYLEVYGAKLAKTALWALLLTPLVWWGLRHPDSFGRWLLAGVISTVLVLLLVVLWERETLPILINEGIGYGFINGLLDASTSYRTTGIFSEMHTGGEVIDGIIILLMPFTLWGLTRPDAKLKVMSAFALLALLYVTFVGFTRATYAAVFVSLLLFFLVNAYLRRSVNLSQFKSLLLPGGLFVSLCVLALLLTGTIGAVIVGGTLLGAALVVRIPNLRPSMQTLLLAMGIGFAIYQMVIHHFNHKWIVVDGVSIAMLFMASLLMPPAIVLTAERLRSLKVGQILLILIFVGSSLILVRQMFSGYQIGSRIETVQADLQTRLEHWQNVLDSGDKDLLTILLGNGVGSFPRNYLLHNPESLTHTGSYDIRQSDSDAALLLGGSRDMTLGQRVSPSSDSFLRVTAQIYNPQQAKIGVNLCRRNVIFASNTDRRCAGAFFDTSDAQEISAVELNLNIKELVSDEFPIYWPLYFHIKNYSEGTVAEVHELQLWQDGLPLLKNSDFSFGSDHWYFYNDFSHLPWHIKNTYIHWYYESGILGLSLFLAIFSIILFSNRKYLDSAFPAALAGCFGFAIVGLFGTPLDSARVSLLFYLIMFSVLVKKNAKDRMNSV